MVVGMDQVMAEIGCQTEKSLLPLLGQATTSTVDLGAASLARALSDFLILLAADSLPTLSCFGNLHRAKMEIEVILEDLRRQ
jgi:hypothetical protein